MKHNLTRISLAIVAAGVLLGGCGGSSNGLPSLSSTNPVHTGTLQFAVGTANIYGSKTGLNVVSTYRTSNGTSNALVNTPTITGPFTIPATVAAGGLGFDPYSSLQGPTSKTAGGPGPLDAAGSITGTPQSVHIGTAAGASNTSTFGQSGGVFTNGISPGNYTQSGVPHSYVPYAEPMYDTLGPAAVTAVGSGTPTAAQAAVYQWVPWCGPPTCDPDKDNMGVRDGVNNLGAGVLGVPEGITIFEGVTGSAGSYGLSTVVPTGFSGTSPTSSTVTASATMGAVTTLPTLIAPAFTTDGSGGGSVTLTAADFSGGITEVIVQIVDYGFGGSPAGTGGQLDPSNIPGSYGCQGVRGPNAGPVYYTLVAKAAGTFTLPDANGPNTTLSGGPSALTPSPSICTAAQNAAAVQAAATADGTTVPAADLPVPGDSYSVQIYGLDYDLAGEIYPLNTSASPTLTGAGGTADITISQLLMGKSN